MEQGSIFHTPIIGYVSERQRVDGLKSGASFVSSGHTSQKPALTRTVSLACPSPPANSCSLTAPRIMTLRSSAFVRSGAPLKSSDGRTCCVQQSPPFKRGLGIGCLGADRPSLSRPAVPGISMMMLLPLDPGKSIPTGLASLLPVFFCWRRRFVLNFGFCTIAFWLLLIRQCRPGHDV